MDTNIESIIKTGLCSRYSNSLENYEYYSYAEFKYADIVYSKLHND